MVKVLIFIQMLFIFSTPVLITPQWQMKTVVFLHWCPMRALPIISYEENEVLWIQHLVFVPPCYRSWPGGLWLFQSNIQFNFLKKKKDFPDVLQLSGHFSFRHQRLWRQVGENNKERKNIYFLHGATISGLNGNPLNGNWDIYHLSVLALR